MARFYSSVYGMGIHPATRAGTIADGLEGFFQGEASRGSRGQLFVKVFINPEDGDEWCRVLMGVDVFYGGASNNWQRTVDTSKAHVLYEGPLGRNPISETMGKAFAYHKEQGF